MEKIYSERDACGVGVVARMDNKPLHEVVTKALTALGCMEHRGGCSADNDSGDGAGIMTTIPWKLIKYWAAAKGLSVLDERKTAVAQIFLPQGEADETAAEKRKSDLM